MSREDAERELLALEGLLGHHLNIVVVGQRGNIMRHLPDACVFRADRADYYGYVSISWAGKSLLRLAFSPGNLAAGDTISLDARGILTPLLKLIETGALK